MKNTKIAILFSLFALSTSFNRRIQCQTIHPVSHATHGIFSSSFDKFSPHDLRSSIKDTFHTFVTQNVKNFLRRMDLEKRLSSRLSSRFHFNLKTEYEESLEEQIKALRQQAKNKKQLAERIQESYDKALREMNNDETTPENSIHSDEKMKKILKHNLDQIKYLNGRVKYLTDKANHLEKHLEEIKKEDTEEKGFICNIQKNGKLIIVNSSNGLKHTTDDVQGKINSDGFDIYYKNQKKRTYYWNLIEMPIKIIGNVEQCFSFLYKNSTQIFCAKNKLQAAAWINALTEGSLCYHFDIKGVVVNQNIDLADKDKKKNSSDVLTVDLKPEENATRVVMNDVEHKLGNNESISLRKIKKEMEEERKVSSGETVNEPTEGLAKATTETEETKEDEENEEEGETN